MKKVLIFVICLTLTSYLFQSCAGKSSVDKEIEKAEKLLDKASKENNKWTVDDWVKFNEEISEPFKAIVEAADKENVSALKKLKIASLMLKYVTVAGTHALDFEKSQFDFGSFKSIESAITKSLEVEPEVEEPEAVEAEAVEAEAVEVEAVATEATEE